MHGNSMGKSWQYYQTGYGVAPVFTWYKKADPIINPISNPITAVYQTYPCWQLEFHILYYFTINIGIMYALNVFFSALALT